MKYLLVYKNQIAYFSSSYDYDDFQRQYILVVDVINERITFDGYIWFNIYYIPKI